MTSHAPRMRRGPDLVDGADVGVEHLDLAEPLVDEPAEDALKAEARRVVGDLDLLVVLPL